MKSSLDMLTMVEARLDITTSRVSRTVALCVAETSPSARTVSPVLSAPITYHCLAFSKVSTSGAQIIFQVWGQIERETTAATAAVCIPARERRKARVTDT